ncbi:methyltransferase domain-containing protein [Deinococcus wulumuqiensis]|uniref:Trans-aconitate 2-methyltransferase n=1 Tax=Deinococcus wulumuqiensis TaxID=980427 RepID=A0AAV4K690_9DEIO|nr:L-histidine N(alpha)-methyltransferase [Deinococcus wulumuqiensis]QII20975.1 methyltransferase domain-containing protein [Deinococcus wulumuqiensis R12]GGI79637.1 trans-aconitate 2-methyltransferase [Deinococcus wulumuqiensis]GGP28976.1 trans-aconitate 2-methyltransferase [Deinococcus wulumuqiensis]
MTWNPDQYHQFKAARSAPARDLQAMLPDLPYARVVDLGCGTGEQTAQLAKRFAQAEVLGLDSSADMLARAAAKLPNLRFEQGEIQNLSGSFDLLYSNAALQWLPDHPRLLARLWEHLNPGGVLAVQVPANHDHASHRLLTETAGEFEAELGGFTRFGTAHGASPVLTPAAYAEVLDGLGAADVTALSRVYPVVLGGAEGLIEWTKGTALVPYLSRLSEADGARFLDAYRSKLKAEFPGERVYYAFTRVLFVATRPEL